MFDFLKGLGKTNGETIAETPSDVSPSGLRLETTESAKTVSEVSERKRKSAKSKSTTFSFEEGNNAAAAAQQQQILDAILDPKVWRGAVAAPGDMMVMVTGRKHWELSDDERDTLAKTGAATARAFAVIDPRWLALTLFSFSVLSIYGGRIVKDLAERAAQKKLMTAKPHDNNAA